MKQIKFYDKENDSVHGGILTDDGDIICGCCGGLIEKDDVMSDIVILETYSEWIDLTEAICGDD